MKELLAYFDLNKADPEDQSEYDETWEHVLFGFACLAGAVLIPFGIVWLTSR